MKSASCIERLEPRIAPATITFLTVGDANNPACD